ncbi:glycosyltransferase family 2 protein [uncultured Jannaschia sp.]|uniref:glycosyltransferase family 2 protein n=1 Tax=uncultured Jannaschia sp. TaxID=293347 RepID=UPI00262E088F|nr:glycosyltransferase family 2 protein [uncultured Jannaschia sp.]
MKPVRDNARAAMETLPKAARGAETGTHAGHHTAALMEIARPAALTLVDPWTEDAVRDARALAQAIPQATRDAQAAAVATAYPDATILRTTSAEALAGMGDGALDWLWLDGGKHYDTILADLEVAARVVRPGGIVAGAGWHWGAELGHPVRAAVTDLAARLPGATVETRGQYWTLRLPDAVRLAPRPEGRFLVVSTMKNEAPYILEWLAHHRALGFDDFLIFTNDCEDGTTALLDRLQARGVLTHQPNRVLRRGPHKSALKWAKDHIATLRAEWIFIADVDEFLDIRAGDGTVPGLLRTLGPETDVVSFPWKVFGNGGVTAFADRLVTAQFTRCEPLPRRGGRPAREVKTLFRKLETMYHLGLHRPRIRDEWVDRIVWKAPDGTDLSGRMNRGQVWAMPWGGCQDAAYLRHYPLRSLEAYILKKNRGRANHVGEDLGRDYWEKWNMGGGRDAPPVVPGFEDALAELRADRGVRQLHRRGVEWHRAQYAALMDVPAYRALREALGATEPADGTA